MPSRSELPGELSRKTFLRALQRFGFHINTVGGKGNHVKVTWPATQKSITVIGDLRKDVLHYVLKEIEIMSGVTWEDIREKL
ncbi:type II toxin-antitoxin system HicA family toxin [Patescibacteria group bacterium]|nr:type II toxin-antitoxin system HicA family toxin [Patescibacteria group bacterium]